MFKFTFSICIVLLGCLISHAQVLNGEFNNQFGSTPDWWYSHGDCDVTRTSEQAFNGSRAALVSNRTNFWNGAGQELNGDLTVGRDYHFQCRVRTRDVASGVIRIEIGQEDDRGTRFFPIVKGLANNSEWTLLEGGFHLLAYGNLRDLRFIINGDYTDDRLFDFYVDSVTITENNWRGAADQRIDQFRKRDVALSFADEDGNAMSNVGVDVQQIGHRFAFGSTLNDSFVNNPAYTDFFRQNFEWATIEYFSQWQPVEEVRGVEDYSRADPSVDFAQENGIQLRGHALTWPDPRFTPEWLFGLSPQVHRNEINERIDNVVSRYAGRLVHWDVNNEMLNFTYFQDTVGDDIRASMFTRARENDPDVKLFTNEFGLVESHVKADRYRQLVQGLQAQGAEVGGIGLQSHFDSNVSPKGMELTLAKLTDLGPEIWFTEFDASNPDPVERGKLLETFYRYAFSVPEAEGIIMWGFWAGTHWRGADASIVDQNWNVNAAGQKYFELIDEWTTSLSASTGNGQSTLSFRGFHGNYLIRTNRNGIEQFHIVPVVPAEAGGDPAQAMELLVSNDPNSDGTIVVYGTDDDDVFKYDFANPTAVEINGVVSNVPVFGNNPKITFVGNDGHDRVELIGSRNTERFLMSLSRVVLIGTQTEMRFPHLEELHFLAGSDHDQMIIGDSAVDDEFVSDLRQTRWLFNNRARTVSNFRNLIVYARNGNDTVTINDSDGDDVVLSDLSTFVKVRSADTLRQFFNFETNETLGASGNEILMGQLSDQATQVNASMNQSEFNVGGRNYKFQNIDDSRVTSSNSAGHLVRLDVSADSAAETVLAVDETVSIREGAKIGFRVTGVRNIRSVTALNDRLLIQDSNGNDTVNADSDGFQFVNGVLNISGSGTGSTIAVSNRGGTDRAITRGTPYRLRLIGGWEN